jgi:hypothetical protein
MVVILLFFQMSGISARAGMIDQSPADSTQPRIPSSGQVTGDNQLHSEFVMDLVFERGTPTRVGSPGISRLIVHVTTGTFEGPGLRGVVGSPSGDWIITRPDSTSLLDMRMVLRTVDSETIYMSWRGIAYVQPNGQLHARIVPMFETGAPKYAWLNKIVAVGVYRPMPGKIEYRIYKIL